MIPADASVLWLGLAIAFLLISGLFWIVRKINQRKNEYAKLEKEYHEAVANHDFVAIDDIRSRMHKYKK